MNASHFLFPSVIKHFREIEGYTTIDVGKAKLSFSINASS